MKKYIIIIAFIVITIFIAILSNIIDDELDGKTIAFLWDSLIEGYGNEYRGF